MEDKRKEDLRERLDDHRIGKVGHPPTPGRGGVGHEPRVGFGHEPRAGLGHEPRVWFGHEPRAGLTRTTLGLCLDNTLERDLKKVEEVSKFKLTESFGDQRFQEPKPHHRYIDGGTVWSVSI